MKFDLKLPYELVKWIVTTYKFVRSGDTKTVLEVEKRVKEQVKYVRQIAQRKLHYPLWTAKIDTIIAQELIDQLIYYKGSYFVGNRQDVIHVPIVFHIAPFALKYLNYRLRVDKNQKELTLSKD